MAAPASLSVPDAHASHDLRALVALPVRSRIVGRATMRANPALRGVQLAAVTGWGAQEDRLRTTEAGFDKHFTKPLDFNELRDYLILIGARVD
jgi:DNA-binding response OmpR family regulator